MNRKKIFIYGMSAVATLLIITGCSHPTITAEYTMPPAAVSNIKNIDTLEIVVNVSMPNNKNIDDESIAKGIIYERFAAGIYSNGFFRTTDIIWGSPAGASQMHSLMQAQKSKHGYARITTAPITPRARIELNFDVNVTSGQRNLVVSTELEKVFYQTKYRTREITWGRGERRNREKIRVPYSVPARTVKSIAQSKVEQYWISAIGSLEAKVIDKNGQTVYRKKFNNLRANAVCDHESMAAIPSRASLFSIMSKDAITAIIKDISPYKESKKIKINKDGDERGFLLLQSMAFSEAFDTFESIKKEERTFADWENLGIIYEVMGDYHEAENCFETAIKIKKADKGFFDYDENIAEDGIVRIKNVINAQKKLESIK